MLPEVLSNGMCSLNPDQDRFAFSSIFEFNSNHEIVSKWFGKTIIHSNKRFSYEAAQEVLDSKDETEFPALFKLQDFAKELQAARKRSGAIDFESDEIKFELDAAGFPIRVFKKDRIFTHHLVEEFMLLANREVAEFMYFNNVHGTKKLLGVYRVHDLPDPEKITDLQIFVNALGLEFHPGKKIHAKDIQKLLDKAAGHPAETTIKTATLRSMAKAAYKTVNIGHFGLAFEYYTHFTSPIRRYPDLSVHRIMQYVLTKTQLPQGLVDSLEDICTVSSSQEVKAAEAERASVRYKQVEYLSKRIGEEFDVVVSGIADFGVFLQEKESLAEGLVRLKDLGSDFFEVDKKTYKVIGQNTKKVITLGDVIHVRLRGIDLENKAVDWEVLKV
jgi:ribonuclease R